MRRRPDPFLGESTSCGGWPSRPPACRRLDARPDPGRDGHRQGRARPLAARERAARDEAFVDLNCAGFSRELLESELFGHEAGAFTGAAAAKQGLFEIAHRGTAFLDEIGDVDLQVQPKLLKVVEETALRRLGDVRDRHVDMRLIAATHQDLDGADEGEAFPRGPLLPHQRASRCECRRCASEERT